MSNPSIALAKEHLRESTHIERDWWNHATLDAKEAIINEVDYTDLNVSHQETALEAYQKDYLATDYDTLPQTIKDIVRESLIAQGELPNPKIGEGFIYNSGDDVLVECDRCDESFTSEADFDQHKSIDHGDDPEDFDKVEETYQLSMNPAVTRESLQEAKRLLQEVEQKKLGKLYFNGGDIKTPTLTIPKAKVKQGYNDNPNEGLYDTKHFEEDSSATRHDGLEAYAAEDDMDDIMSKNPDNKIQLKGTRKEQLEQIRKYLRGENDEAVEYDESATIADIKMVGGESAPKTFQALEGIDFSEEEIDYVYPTKASEAYVEPKDPFLVEYGDESIESDAEAVENQIIDRKLRGYGDQAIASELMVQYGVDNDAALEKVHSVEVSVNDKVANTFFGKRFSECTEAEIRELRVLSGSDDE